MDDAIQILDIVAWPLVLVTALALLVTEKGARFLVYLLRRVRRVSALGVEIELNPEAAVRTRRALDETFQDYRDLIQSEFDREAERRSVAAILDKLVEEDVIPYLKARAGGPIAAASARRHRAMASIPYFNTKTRRRVATDSARRHRALAFRATIYVEDMLFKEALYQLVDYVPSGKGRGRIYSTRFGIIGRTWRLERSDCEPVVSDDITELVRNWGMTRIEAAAAGQGHQSFVCVLLRHEDLRVGLLYLDAPEPDAFGEDVLDRLTPEKTAPLAKAVGGVVTSLAVRGPRVEIFGDE